MHDLFQQNILHFLKLAFYPLTWSEIIIVPLDKEGDVTNSNNTSNHSG